MEAGSKGSVSLSLGGTMEFIMLNATDPGTKGDGERSHISTRHPLLKDLVRGDGCLIPLMFRLNVSASNNRLAAPLTGWDLDMSSLADGHRLA